MFAALTLFLSPLCLRIQPYTRVRVESHAPIGRHSPTATMIGQTRLVTSFRTIGSARWRAATTNKRNYRTHSLSTGQFRETQAQECRSFRIHGKRVLSYVIMLTLPKRDDEELEVDRLESRLRQVRTVQHRSYSQWNDSATTNRPVLQPVEVKPSVRIMKRDTTAESMKKKDDTEVVQQ